MTEKEEIKAYIEGKLKIWAADYIASRKSALRQRKIEASGNLIASLEAEINKAASREAIELLMSFPDYGRIIDQRKVRPARGGAGYIEMLEDWIKKKGEAKFVAGWKRRNKAKKIPKNIVNRIAWGIAIKRSNGRFRRKQWYNKSKSAAITDLFNQVAAGLPDITANQVTKNFKNGNS
jgi:hypothetical protein